MDENGLFSCPPPKPCPPSKPLCSRGDCYSSCPVLTLLFNSTYCIDTSACNKIGWKQYGSRCVEECPHFTYELPSEYSLDEIMECDTMAASIATTLVSLFFISLCCALLKYQLTTKHPVEEDTCQVNEPMNETRSLLDTDQTEVLHVWTDHGGHSQSNHVPTGDITSTNVKCNYSDDDDSLLDVRQGPDPGYIHSGHSHPVFRNDDEFSSVPTVVRLRGYQDDSMDISEYSSDTEHGVSRPYTTGT